MAENTKQDDIKKSIDSVVDQILSNEKTEKSMPTSLDANGGQDKIRSGTPLQTEEELKAAKEKEDKEKAEKAQADAANADPVAKAQKEKEDKEKADKEKKDKDDKKPAFLKKSVEELASLLDEEELELIKAWREQPAEQTAENLGKSQAAAAAPAPAASDRGEELKKALSDIVAPLQKAMSEKDDLIKALGDKIEKMASQPAYDRRSVSTLEALEKGGSSEPTNISKKQVTDKMLDLQVAGKGVTSHHISEFEATGNISDPIVKSMVFKELKLN